MKKILKYLFWVLFVLGIVVIYNKVLNEPSKIRTRRPVDIGLRTYIAFYNIDNEARITVNDSLIFNSGMINDNPSLVLDIDIEEYLKSGNNVVRIEVHNDECNNCHHNPWGVRYEFIEGYEIVDYVNESSLDESSSGGLKFEKIYEVFYNPEQ
jgi:hypothetical protein